MSDEGPPPNPGDTWRNFWGSDLPLAKRVVVAFRNNLIKVRTRKSCCGNFGEPGC